MEVPMQVTTQSDRLTRREVEVLQHIVTGDTNKEIASKLYCSKRTVDFHLQSIYRKLNASNRLQAMNLARNMGILVS